jgi:TonB family protein
MRPFASLTLAAAFACLCATTTPAQSGHARHKDPPGVGRGGSAEQSPRGGGGEPGKSAHEDDTHVFTSSEVSERARLTRRPAPDYPREARRKTVQGIVALRLILRADGRVDDKIEVVRSLPEGLTEEAVRVAKLIEFEPARKDGRKVSQYALVEYNFNLY